MNNLIAKFRFEYPQGAVTQVELEHPVDGFSVTAFLGPSGCGKTTLLRVLAGLERNARGTIRFGDQTWLDSQQRKSLSPVHRKIGFMFQEYALFPHLTVAQNIEYGIRRVPAEERRRRVTELLNRFGMSKFSGRYPLQLSGGQQQRIALARSVACRPQLLLLDEPLSALDAVQREATRMELRGLLEEDQIPVILVTHDRHEALSLADHVALMNDGEILQTGSISEVFNRPKTPVVAGMVGVETTLPGRVESTHFPAQSPTHHQSNRIGETSVVSVGNVSLTVAKLQSSVNNVYVCIRGADVEIVGPASPAAVAMDPNRIPATITRIQLFESTLRIEMNCGFPLVAILTRQLARSLALQVGQQIEVNIPVNAIHLINR